MNDIPGAGLEPNKPTDAHNGFFTDWANGASYSELWQEHPLSTAGATAGAAALTVAGLYGAYRWGPSAIKALPGLAMKYGPAAAAGAVGVYGGGKLLFADGGDTFSGNSLTERSMNLLRSASDVSILGGATVTGIAALTHNPSLAIKGLSAMGLGAGTRVGLSYFGAQPETPVAPATALGQTQHWSVDAPTTNGGKEKRLYDAYIPPDAKGKLPVVLVLHGVAGGDAQGLMERETGLDALADEKKFIAVYPVAKEKNAPYMLGAVKMQDWNSPGAGLSVTQSSYDDVDYIKSVIADLKTNKHLNIDENAIYAMGFSSGGEFANHLRGTMPGVFAGIGSVHGTVLGSEASLTKGDDTASVFVVSDSDHMVPRDGGRGIMTLPFSKMSTSEPLKQLDLARDASGCLPFPVVTQNGFVRTTEYRPADPGGAFAKLVSIDGGLPGGACGSVFGRGSHGIPAEHAWDGTGKGGWPILGEKNPNLDISRMLIDDLLKHRRHAQSAAVVTAEKAS